MAQSNQILNGFSNSKYIVSVILFVLISLNLVNAAFFQSKETVLKSKMTNNSKGESYNAALNYWTTLAKVQDWPNADVLEKYLTSEDVSKYMRVYHPNFLELSAQNISQKKEIGNEDYLELSKIYVKLGQYQNAVEAVKKARQVDLLRTDIEKINSLY